MSSIETKLRREYRTLLEQKKDLLNRIDRNNNPSQEIFYREEIEKIDNEIMFCLKSFSSNGVEL